MHAAEVEKSHVEVNGGGQMFHRLAEPQAQARKATKMRPHAQIGALGIRIPTGAAHTFTTLPALAK